jgi:hypothetical protein
MFALLSNFAQKRKFCLFDGGITRGDSYVELPSSGSSSSAGNFDERRLPTIQPIAPSTTVRPSQISNKMLRTTLKTVAKTPARIMPMVRPAVTPIKQPGCLRLRPRNCFIIEQIEAFIVS